MRQFITLLLLGVILMPCKGGFAMDIPVSFPEFRVPGHVEEMQSLRELYWLHFNGSGPKATMWDVWLPSPALWPAVEGSTMREQWKSALLGRDIDSEGYVSTHQHASIAHPGGWPFPFWNQGRGMGWHFSFKDTVGLPWRPAETNTTEGWQIIGAADEGIDECGWKIKLTEPKAYITTPKFATGHRHAPFMQIRWKAKGLGNAQPYIEWTTAKDPEFSREKRLYFAPIESESIVYTTLTMFKHPKWKGNITQIRLNFDNKSEASVTLQAMFTVYDTRHDTNGQSYVRGCATYFNWTRDLNFLRENINRMRMALRYVMDEHHALSRKVVWNTWVGHEGTSGIKYVNGEKQIQWGNGIGDNYWDLIPFGYLDCYATISYYAALNDMAEIEQMIINHPEWNIPRGVLAFDPEWMQQHAAEVKQVGNELFWNDVTERFAANVNIEEKKNDYGFTFLNLDAIAYDFATPEHAQKIMQWLEGERIVEDDTSKGEDIYHWRFGPRATTKRNIDYYFWGWTGPETIEFGGQIQDGGAVLGFSYQDLMARIKTLGADNAWARLQEIVKWFDEVQEAGGYRKYYDGSRDGTLQGGGTAGGLGFDAEFFESVLVPTIMLDGFMGFTPKAEGIVIEPKLPSDWPELVIDRVQFRDTVLTLRATHNTIEIIRENLEAEPFDIQVPSGYSNLTMFDADGNEMKPVKTDGDYVIDLSAVKVMRFARK